MSSMNKSDFISRIIPAAIDEMRETRILASLTIAQAILESAWARSSLASKHNNLFGVKATAANKEAGLAVCLPTTEYRGGVPLIENHYFRTYKDWGESIRDHSRLLQLKRYLKVIGETDYKNACYAIQQAGYATDPNYALLLIRVIEDNKLYEIDREVLKVTDTAAWKTAIMKDAAASGLITDGEHKADDPAPKWFVCAVALNTIRKGDKK